MRKLFLFLLVLLSLWIWSLDLVDIVFYYLNYQYSHFAGYSTALIVFGVSAYLFTKLFLRHFELKKDNLRIKKEQLKEFGVLVLFFLPILFLNYQRIMFPDAEYDVRAYHLFLHRLNRLENLNNFNLVGGAGGGTYFFTLSYKSFGFFRELLGYRLGTIFNTCLLFLIYLSVYDFLKQFLATYFHDKRVLGYWLAASALFVIFADNTLFNLNSYKVDVIGVPLLLELINLLFFKPVNTKNKISRTVFFFLIASITIAYKLTFLPYVLIIGACFLARNYKIYLENKKLILGGFLLLVFPSIYLVYNYTETLNPIFPFYNKLFESPLYEIRNFKDERWGPRNFLEIFYYNIISFIHKERNNEWQAFSIRLLAEYLIIITSLAICIYHRFNIRVSKIRFVLYLSIIALLCNYMLLFTTGYYRYGVLIEILFGVIMILWLYYLFFLRKWIFFGLLLCLVSIQCITTFKKYFLEGINLSWYEYKNLRTADNGNLLKGQVRLLFNDYDTGVDSTIKRLNISAFLSSECNGFTRLIAPEIPIYNTSSFGQRQLSVDEFEKNKIDTLSQRHNFFTVTIKEELMQKIDELNRRNYYVDSIVDIYPKFTVTNTPLYLLKIKHYDKGFSVINKHSILRVDSSGVSPHYFYSSKNKFKTYIIEDPYTYNWSFRPDSCKFTVNDVLYHSIMTGTKNKIVTLQESNKLSFINSRELHYFIIVQELQTAEGVVNK